MDQIFVTNHNKIVIGAPPVRLSGTRESKRSGTCKGKFDNAMVARLLSMLPPQSSEAASQLFKGVW